MAYPEPSSGGAKGGGRPDGPYPEPKGGPIDLGLDKTTHNANYPNLLVPGGDTAPPGAVPGPDAYKVTEAQAPGPTTTGNPGVKAGNAGNSANK